MHKKSIPAAIAFLLVAVIAGCLGRELSSPAGKTGSVMKKDEALNLSNPHFSDLYFTDPKTAVTVISGLIQHSDWLTLSRYYDLSGSDIDRDELESGRFFVRTERPPVAHPGGFWRIRHPFHPRFRYRYHQSLSGGPVRVHLSIKIDQGGGMVQQGRHSFLLRRSEKGYQILPFETDEKDPAPSLVK